MFLRFALTVAVVFSTAFFVEAAVIQVDFTAELESSSSGFEPVTTVSGYFKFDDSSVQDLAANLFGASSYVELIEFGVETSLGVSVSSSGIVTESVGQLIPGRINLPVISSYVVSVGVVVYPPSTVGHQGQESGLVDDLDPDSHVAVYGEDGVLIGIAIDFGDLHVFTIDIPYVPSAVISLFVYLSEHDVLFDSPHVPLVLSQSRDSKLEFNYLGHSATYLLTSLQIAPEPTSLGLVGVAMVFGMLFRRRV